MSSKTYTTDDCLWCREFSSTTCVVHGASAEPAKPLCQQCCQEPCVCEPKPFERKEPT